MGRPAELGDDHGSPPSLLSFFPPVYWPLWYKRNTLEYICSEILGLLNSNMEDDIVDVVSSETGEADETVYDLWT